jgi:hypothetical protein
MKEASKNGSVTKVPWLHSSLSDAFIAKSYNPLYIDGISLFSLLLRKPN